MIWSIVVGVVITPIVILGLIGFYCWVTDGRSPRLEEDEKPVNRLPMLEMIQNELLTQGVGQYTIYVSIVDFKFLADTFFGGSPIQPEFVMIVLMRGSEVRFCQHSMAPESRFYLVKDLIVGHQLAKGAL